jgi:2-polyprenyl-6-methoxyphenol hydroxylase-like FAD-dependent oxidoreductase
VTRTADALVIGAGPAGAGAAILLSRAGWEVILVEQDAYPRRKVCGECLSAGTLGLLDELGVGAGVRESGGPELRQIAWMSQSPTLIADFPVCSTGPYSYGRAVRREYLDGLLVDQARALGVVVLQPARVLAVRGEPGAHQCDIELAEAGHRQTLRASAVIDAHGSWQRGPAVPSDDGKKKPRRPQRGSDLFAFKAVFEHTRLRPGLLPVIALPGGYGGMVVADGGLTTLACCIRRDTLAVSRAACRQAPAGEAVEMYLRRHCRGAREALEGAHRAGPWLTVGPLRTGMHHPVANGPYRVGNAAGESHPLIGEGISMALQSAALLARELTRASPAQITARMALDLQSRYALAWRREFSRRLHMAALYAHMAMRPTLAVPVRALLERWPDLLTAAARLAGKARISSIGLSTYGVHNEYA